MSNYSTDIETAELGENGLSKKAGWITVYRAHHFTREYHSASMEYLMLGVGLPAHSYPDEPELPPVGQALHRSADGKLWEFSPDHRGQTVYGTETRQEQTVTQFGELPDNVTLLKPETEFDEWNGKKWVTDTKAQQAAESLAEQQAAQQELSSRLTVANTRIETLSDAVDLDMATHEEKTALKGWRTYRVQLSRIDISTAPDIDWPEAPEGGKTVN
ncbi:tail fiber assembly protein [Symbiopectobacterium purcellii]|uniref:Tail fiber assembly protein n=1 Tax=Symbiopectobacterium purcellii TaxID=2871826 RepID=A0ABX9AMQ2_9ENTR|nr:tail fiber assembly protein [Symbiopectobacterium purcellii]QZN96419.1 tail fiber assembly protein [Symbiopectobacterium purcellii]QZN96467.1 tail fiber assembly protein [Symbiopectobacterium purcellii]